MAKSVKNPKEVSLMRDKEVSLNGKEEVSIISRDEISFNGQIDVSIVSTARVTIEKKMSKMKGAATFEVSGGRTN